MMITFASVVLQLGMGLTAADCDDSRWAECVGWPADTQVYDQRDPAVASDPAWSEQSSRERVQHWQQRAAGDGEDAVRALIELGWHETQRKRRNVARNHYERAFAIAISDPVLRRRLHWSRAQSCAHAGDFRCAREHWWKAGAQAEDRPSWLPAAYAYGLWQLGEHAQAIAWYMAAVHGNASLGRGDQAGLLASGTPLNAVSRELFAAWSAQYAPMLATVVAQIDIGPEGRVQRVVLTDHRLSSELASRVQLAIAGWRFEPPRHEGRPVVLTTHAHVDVRGRVDEDGSGRFEVQHVFSGLARKPQQSVGLNYPKEALRKRREGQVLIHVRVGPDGAVEQADVVRSSGHRELDQSALSSVGRWQFLTDSIDGEPLPGEISIPITFQLSGAVEPQMPYGQIHRAIAIQALSRGLWP